LAVDRVLGKKIAEITGRGDLGSVTDKTAFSAFWVNWV